MINKTSKEYYEKYSNLAKEIGISYKGLKEINFGPQCYTKEELIEKFKEDKNLNNIPLKYWDEKCILYCSVRITLAEKVCLLKHLVIYDIIGAIPKFE
jgi:hypothetical protein